MDQDQALSGGRQAFRWSPAGCEAFLNRSLSGAKLPPAAGENVIRLDGGPLESRESMW